MVDSCARLTLGRKRFGAYRAMGICGFIAGFATTLALGAARHVAWSDLAIVLVTVPSSFLLALKLSAILFGRERIVFYEKTLFAMAAVALATSAAHGHVALAVDLAVVGIGTFLVFGRIGCLMVGCCHGRPARWGIRYGPAHADEGFPRWLVERPLFPIQLVDAAVSAAATFVAAAGWLHGARPGWTAAVYLSIYGMARFLEEPFRGDSARPLWRGATEAQWTAVVIAWAIAAFFGASAATVIPAVALSILLLVLTRRCRQISDPWHVAELARALEALAAGDRQIATSSGLRVSLAVLETGQGRVREYAFTSDIPLAESTLAPLARDAGLDPATIRPGATPGVFYVLAR